MQTKKCTLCKETKSLSAFCNHRGLKDGKSYWCKECNRKRTKIYRSTPSGIYTQIKGRALYDNRTKPPRPFELKREEFIEWYKKTPKVCAYCDLPEELLHKVGDVYNNQVLRLTIDCKNNGGGYFMDNIVLACKRCNSIKSDLLTFGEMREFAQKYLKPKWILKNQSIQGKAIEG